MSLLQLKDIGKIYVSEGNVAVGIRGVNLSFDKGEFVAITGKSGSGKSTLLNVISGMDTYEEGDMLIEGHSTSHYLQPEWEEYRQKYISFIFQDYNIIDSFTVLQNVELALMYIKDKRERRKRAVTLLKRVGLGDRMNQRGSKLSGGQKQRTVIARALAKDSPIILADEPTGNLDSKTSEEIISLLREVAKDKLLIMVTHNFDQVEHVATRHIRVFDGAVESDHVLTPAPASEQDGKEEKKTQPVSASRRKINEYAEKARNGFTLGKTIFTSTPKLSTFLCLLLIVGILAIFAITSFCATGIQDTKQFIFNHIDGRVVITTQEGGEAIGDETVKELAEKYGAKEYLTCDYLLDQTQTYYFRYDNKYSDVPFQYTYDEHYGNNIIGDYPQSEGEVLLYLPLYLKPKFGGSVYEMPNSISIFDDAYPFKISGIKYYADNTKTAKILLTKEGFNLVSGLYAKKIASITYNLSITAEYGGQTYPLYVNDIIPSPYVEKGKIYTPDILQQIAGLDNTLNIDLNAVKTQAVLSASYSKNDQSFKYVKTYQDAVKVEKPSVTRAEVELSDSWYSYPYYDYIEPILPGDPLPEYGYSNVAYVSPEIYREMTDKILSDTYTQASLIFNSDGQAHKVVNSLKADGYLPVPSDSTYLNYGGEYITNLLSNIFVVVIWCLVILFVAMFISLCTRRTIGAFKGDMAIMRSMGIPVKIIRIAMYVRMFIALIPAFITLLIAALVIFLTPATNAMFLFLHAWEYVAIVLGMIALTFIVTHSQIRRLFKQSVKKSLKGGATE